MNSDSNSDYMAKMIFRFIFNFNLKIPNQLELNGSKISED